MRHPSLLVAALALALGIAPLARAQAPAADPGAAAGEAPFPPLRLVAQVGWSYGSDELVLTTGGGRTLRANGGSSVAVGATFLPLLAGRLYTQATIGLTYDVLTADDGDAAYVAFPLEVLEFSSFPPFRVGVGVNVHLGGRVAIDTSALDETRDLEPAIGLAAQADFVWRFRGASRGFLTIGPRLLLQEIDVEGGGTLQANAYGVGLGFTF